MSSKSCPPQERLVELFYEELDPMEKANFQNHFSECFECSKKWKELNQTLLEIDLPVPNGGERGLRAAINFLGLGESRFPGMKTPNDEILTLEETAKFLKVPLSCLKNKLSEIPHFIFEGYIRIRKSSLEEYLKDLEKKPKHSVENIRSLFLKREIL